MDSFSGTKWNIVTGVQEEERYKKRRSIIRLFFETSLALGRFQGVLYGREDPLDIGRIYASLKERVIHVSSIHSLRD